MREFFEKAKSFIKESYQEFRKVKWPSKDELIGLTIAVVVSSIILMIFLGIIDRLFYMLIRLVMG